MRNAKRWISTICALTMTAALALTGCGGSDKSGTSSSSTSTVDEKTMIIPLAGDISGFYTVGLDDMTN